MTNPAGEGRVEVGRIRQWRLDSLAEMDRNGVDPASLHAFTVRNLMGDLLAHYDDLLARLRAVEVELAHTAGEGKAIYDEVTAKLRAVEAELAEEHREALGVEGRCQVGHNKKFTGMLAGQPVCVACERDAAQAEARRLQEKVNMLRGACREKEQVGDRLIVENGRLREALVQAHACATVDPITGKCDGCVISAALTPAPAAGRRGDA